MKRNEDSTTNTDKKESEMEVDQQLQALETFSTYLEWEEEEAPEDLQDKRKVNQSSSH